MIPTFLQFLVNAGTLRWNLTYLTFAHMRHCLSVMSFNRKEGTWGQFGDLVVRGILEGLGKGEPKSVGTRA